MLRRGNLQKNLKYPRKCHLSCIMLHLSLTTSHLQLNQVAVLVEGLESQEHMKTSLLD